MLQRQSNGGSAMKRTSLFAIAFASLALGGCATYDYVGDTAPGGYYHGRPSTQYYDPYGGYYGGVGSYGGYGYGGPYRYSSYYGYPYYGYYGSHYPYYPPHHHPRPPRPGDNTPKPPGNGGSGNRPPPWRDPTGRWREGGSQPMVPNRPGQVIPSPSQPRVGEGGYRPPRVMPSPNQPRMSEGGYRPPRVTSSPSAPRAVERPQQRMERPAPARVERPAPPPRPSSGRSENATRQLER
jgi:hypothetical protein